MAELGFSYEEDDEPMVLNEHDHETQDPTSYDEGEQQDQEFEPEQNASYKYEPSSSDMKLSASMALVGKAVFCALWFGVQWTYDVFFVVRLLVQHVIFSL